MNRLTYLASRIFETPLMIRQEKLEVILQVLGPRLGLCPSEQQIAVGDRSITLRADSMMPMDDDEIPMDHPRGVPEGIAVIDIIGPLVKRQSGFALSGGPTTYAEIEEQFMAAVANGNVRGILLNIDSPGGEVGGAFDLASLIFSQRGKKTCYAVSNDAAYSAAYAIASGAERVFVTDEGGAGSIGVVALHVDQSGFDEKMGLKYTYITAGKKKAEFNPHEPLSDDAQATLQAEIDRLCDKFCSTVALHRGMKADAVRAMEAGVFWGPNAVSMGLCDQVGTFQDAVNALDVATRPNGFQRAASAAMSTDEVSMNEETIPAEPEAAEEQMPGADASSEPPAAEAAPPEVPPVDSNAVIELAVTQAYEHAAEITALCITAGAPDKVAGFIRAKKSAEDARAELLRAKAAESDADPITSHASPGASGSSGDPYRPLAEQRAKDKGITFHAAYVQVVAENPNLYQQYLAERQAIQKKA